MFKKIIKWVSITIGVVFIVLVVLVALLLHYGAPQTKAQKLESEYGALAYTELLALAKTSQPNPDPYASSQIKPGNPLFEGVLALQQKRQMRAREVLKPLAEAGNADAMFWYGDALYQTGIYKTVEAGVWFDKAAALGNPYAALRLDSKTSDCENADFGVNICNEKWKNKYFPLLEVRAKAGDVMAIYKNSISDVYNDSEAYYHARIKLVTEAAKAGYYGPLYKAMSRLEKDKNITPEKKQAIIDLLTLAANNNFVPAMSKLVGSTQLVYLSEDERALFDMRAAKLGSQSSLFGLARFNTKLPRAANRQFVIDAYMAGMVEKAVFEKDGFTESYLKRNNLPLGTDAEKKQAQAAADKFIKEMTPVIFIDERDDYLW